MESHNKNIYAAYKAVNSHSDPDELQHWKYIKREKINGKWRYYYDVGKNEKLDAGHANVAVRYAKENVNFHRKKFQEVKRKVDSGEFFDKDKGNQSIVEPYQKKYNSAVNDYKKAVAAEKRAKEAYSKTPLSKIENAKAKIDNGRNIVAKFIKNQKETTIDKINHIAVKGENWLKNLFEI